MDQAELADLIEELRSHRGDHLTCEAKRAKGGLPPTLWESISAFANAEGGRIVLGVDEKSGLTITGVDDPAVMEAQLASVCSEMEPPVRAEIRTLRAEGKSVVVCVVPPTPRKDRPCHKKVLGPWAGSRIRVADGDRKLTDYEVTLLLANRTEPRHDLTPVVTASPNDLDPRLLDAFLRRIRDTKSEIFSRVDDERALVMLNVLTTYEDRIVPTLAGLLAFGIYPQTFEPQLDVTVVAYPTIEPGVLGRHGERFTENRSIDGPIPAIVTECIRVLKRNMRRRSIMSGIFRIDEWEYPEEVLRESLVNALVHRDYSGFARGTQVQVELYPDRLMIRNPGGLYGAVELSTLGTTTVTSSRNGVLLKILEDTPLVDGHMVCENRGTGIARILAVLTEAGMEPPRFTDDIATFTVEFPNHALLDEDSVGWLAALPVGPLTRSQMTALVMMRNGVVLTNSSYRAATGVQDSRTATRHLKELVDAGIVEQAGTRGTTTYQFVPPPPVGPQLTANETRILRALEDAALTRSEIERATKLTRDQVLHALNTLREKGQITMIGKPRSRTARWTAAESTQEAGSHRPVSRR